MTQSVTFVGRALGALDEYGEWVRTVLTNRPYETNAGHLPPPDTCLGNLPPKKERITIVAGVCPHGPNPNHKNKP